MSRLLLLNIFIVASFVILKVVEGKASCETVKCAGPAYTCKVCPGCDQQCGKPKRYCKLDCEHIQPGCSCSEGYCRNSQGECKLEKNYPHRS
ncbi:uncharacterized protein LOC141530734 [Cotesia typhae]|uniref:uncharacterized protein LOC141530734 n=1 Tax=Cotesia typhae TaxID=2053667 RepID=UPI003D684809